MMKKIFLIFLLANFLILLFSDFCFAQKKLEIEYPALPGVETPMTTKTTLPAYLRYIFTLAIIIAGILAFIAMVLGGIKYLTSAGAPAAMADARDQITSGILGVIILLASFLILNTINPQLILPKKPPIAPAIAGIYAYVKTNCEDDPADPYDDRVTINYNVPNLDEVLPKDVNNNPQSLKCIKFRTEKENLIVNVYSGTDYLPEPPVYADNEGVDNIKNVTGKSIKLDWRIPGAYLYASDNCTGDDFKIYQASSTTLPGFNDKTKSIKFIYGDKDPDTGQYRAQYAAILHQHENFMGAAMLYDQDQGIANCKDLSTNPIPGGVPTDIGVSSITVYLKPVMPPPGEGVKLWEHKNYDGNSTVFYKDVNLANLDGYNLHDAVTSVEIQGNYVAMIFENTNFAGKCEVFMTSDPNLRDNFIGQCWPFGRGDCSDSLIVRPRK